MEVTITDAATGAPVSPAEARGMQGRGRHAGTASVPASEPGDGAEEVTAAAADCSGAAVLGEARDFLARFWVPPSPAALDLMALWAAHAHVRDKDGELAFYSTPRLAFVSDEPGSGKTKALDLLGVLCPAWEQVSDPTAPALLELINTRKATIGIDEIDLLFGAGQAAKAVRNVLNTGYRRGGNVARVKGPQSTFSAVALAGLATSYMGNPTLAPTRERSVIVHCRKPPGGVRPQKYREQIHAPVGALTGASLGAWAAAHVTEIATAWPDLPEGLDGRQEDVWSPLFAVAAIAGGDWPERCEAACREFTTGTRAGDPELPPRLRLLADIRRVWPAGESAVTLAELAGLLAGLPGTPWRAMWTPVVMTREIPAMLGVPPVNVGGKAGYTLAQITEEG